MSTQMKEAADQRIFHGTNRHKGRHISITPDNSEMTYLVYGRIILDQEPRETPNHTTGGQQAGGLARLWQSRR